MHTNKQTNKCIRNGFPYNSNKSFVGQIVVQEYSNIGSKSVQISIYTGIFIYRWMEGSFGGVMFALFRCFLFERGLFLEFFILSNKKWSKVNTLTRIRISIFFPHVKTMCVRTIPFTYIFLVFVVLIFSFHHIYYFGFCCCCFFPLCFDLPNDFCSVVCVLIWSLIHCGNILNTNNNNKK